jgi:predicted outer membrane protein
MEQSWYSARVNHNRRGKNMTVKSRRTAVGAALAAFALVGVTACGGNVPQVPNLPTPPSIPGIGDPKAAFGNAHQSALGLAALGGLGVAQGAGQDVKDLAPQVQSEGQGIDQKLRGLASSVGVTLPDQVNPEVQAQLDDLKARTGEQFDQGWLQAAQAEQQKLRDQAAGLLTIPGLPADQKAAAEQQLGNLDQLGQKLAAASAAAGAATPGGDQSDQAAGGGQGDAGAGQGGGSGSGQGDGSGSGQGGSGQGGSGDGKGGPAVNAGTGGQAAESDAPVLPLAFGGLGLVLIAGAGVWLRRSRA